MTSSFPGDFTTVTNISGEFVDNDIDTISIDTDSGSNSGTQTSGEIASGTTTTISATDTLSAESDSSWVDGVDTITISLGGNPITVQPAATDTATSGGRLLKEKQGKLHIDILGDGTSLLSIVDNSGGTPTFDSSSSWSDSYSSGSWKQQSIAVEKQSDGTYKLAIKTTDVYNGTTNINWNVYSINSSGVLDWGNSSWGGITKHEADFNQDLNGDGVIGIAAEALTSVSTDTYGARLKRDSENGLYIDVDNDGSNLIAIVDNYGGTPTFDSSGSMGDSSSSTSWAQESVAVEQQSDGTFKLAVKNTNTYNGTTQADWHVYTISNSGVLDWSNSSWGGISKHETDFNQDLNGDGGIGLTAALTSVTTDTTGARLKRDAENGLYIDVNNDGNTIIAIEDNYGGTPSFDSSGSWEDSYSSSSWAQESVAVEEQSDGTFKLAVKNTNTHNGDTRIDWSVYSISSTGVLDWMNTSWGGITKHESKFNQDLNGDGGIGLAASLKLVSTDTTGARLKRDADNGLYIDDAGTIIAIEDNYGGTPTFDYSNSWSDEWSSSSSASESIAVEKQSDGTYKLAIKNTNSWDGNDEEINWNIYTISDSGILDWSNTSWSSGIIKYEADFNQDLNGDGGIGLNAALTSVATDTTGARLKRDSEKGLYIDDGGTIIAIEDNYGGTPTFDYSGGWSDEWSSSTWASESIAVEKQSDGTFKLAVKNTNTWTDKSGTAILEGGTNTDINWNVYTISSSGVLDWSQSTWGGITKHESKFNQDLNGDGGIGLLAALTSVSTDITGARLKRDAENGLYIDVNNDGTTIIAIEDNHGGTPTFDYEGSWSDEWSSSSWSSTSFAVEQQSDGSFKLAVKHSDTYNGTTNNNWNVYSISSAGILDWSKSTWGGIAKHEEDFNQDLNGDGGIGLTAALTSVSTDTTGARLKRDSEKGLYIDVNNDGNTIIAIEDNYGGTPTFDYSNSWNDGITSNSWSQESVAVEEQTDGSFKLAVKNTNSWDGNTETNWNTYTISSSGVLDWSNSTWGGIAKHEAKFNQDLNGDGGIGLTAALTSVATDTTGARLKRDSEKGLYIDVNNDGTTIIAIEDNYGGTPTFDHSNSWSDTYYGTTGSWVQESIAVEQQSDGSFKLAVKSTDTYNGTATTNWNTYTISSTGVLDWANSTWGGIAKHEAKFNQDLNGDGATGVSTTTLTAANTDTTGARLKKDSENGLYIDVNNDGQNLISIVDNYGNNPNFDNSQSWYDGSYSQESIAVEQQSDGSFKLAVKNTNTWDGTTEINWGIYTVSSTGILDWSDSAWGGITKHESDFKQDLNGDGTIGIESASLVAVSTDKVGARLKRDSENALYIDVNNDGTNIIAITDEWGGTPTFDYSSSWTDGSNTDSWSQESVAVEAQSNGSFKLAVKNTNTYNGTTDTDWSVYTISASGVLDWSNSSWGAISKHENSFNQDLNDDGAQGISTSLTTIATDTTGALLKEDSENALYIVDGSNTIAITDQMGGTPSFTHSSSWSNGTNTNTWTQAAIAVEKQSDNTYKLAVKNTNNENGVETIDWNVYSLSSDGVLDWSNSTWGGITKHESKFNQDLNDDGQIGLNETLTTIVTDDIGALLKRDSEYGLYIVDGGTTIEIVDAYGGQPKFDHQSTWTDGKNNSQWKQEAYATQKQADNSYVLAIKNTNTYNDDINIDWAIYKVSSEGVIDWNASWGAASQHETKFEQDLNGDGIIGRSTSLEKISTDTTGAELRRDSEGVLYIDVDGDDSTTDDVVAVTDSYGGTPEFNYSSEWTNGEETSQWDEEAIAVEQQSDKTYRLAVRTTNTYNGTTDVNWTIYHLSNTGVLDWQTSEWHPNTDNIALTTFNQDLSLLDSNNDRTSTAADVMIGAGGTTSEASNSPVEIVSNEELSTATLEQTAKDTGSAAAIKPLTDLMDFKINIADSSQHGTIQSVSFKLSATESNLVYYKLDSITNTYYEFNYDSATGEGARFSKSNDSLGYNDIMTLFIRDNGVHDSDSTEGVIRDPGYIGAVATATLQKAENTVVETVEPNSNETATSTSATDNSSTSTSITDNNSTSTSTTDSSSTYTSETDNNSTSSNENDTNSSDNNSDSETPQSAPNPYNPSTTTNNSSTYDAVQETESIPLETPDNGTVSTLNANEISELTLDFIQSLSENQLSTFSPKAIKGFTSDQISMLDPVAVSGLTSIQLRKLDPNAVKGFTNQQVEMLEPEAMKGLRKKHITMFTSKAVRGFSSEQIESLPTSSFKAFKKSQLSNLSHDALTGLTKDQLRTLSSSEFSSIKTKRLKFIDPGSIAGLKPKTLNSLSGKQVKAFTELQADEFTKKQLKKAEDFSAKYSRIWPSLSPLGSEPSFRIADTHGEHNDLIPDLHNTFHAMNGF